MNIRVEIKGCDAETELELVCTAEQYAFLRELAKATKSVSDSEEKLALGFKEVIL